MNEALTVLMSAILSAIIIFGVLDTIAYLVTRNDLSRFRLYLDNRNPPPPPEKSIDDMSVRELYESYEFHRNKTIELGKAVKKLESAVSEFRKNKSYEI